MEYHNCNHCGAPVAHTDKCPYCDQVYVPEIEREDAYPLLRYRSQSSFSSTFARTVDNNPDTMLRVATLRHMSGGDYARYKGVIGGYSC